jgi:SAM-dependent methyltransferase
MHLEQSVAAHYATGSLVERIRAALAETGVDPENAGPDDLKAVDEFHTGGIEATDALLTQLPLGPGTRVLDIGCGIGGTARHLARHYGCEVAGVDLTPDYIEAARALSEMVGVEARLGFHLASALDLPFGEGEFDAATMFHAGMNIEDKARLFREVRRVLRPGGVFGLFDVMRGEAEEPLVFPLPWSARPETSFVAKPLAYRTAALAAGFRPVRERIRGRFALDYFARVFARIRAEGPPPLGIHLLMGETAGEKIGTYVENVKAGRIAPVEMILRAV